MGYLKTVKSIKRSTMIKKTILFLLFVILFVHVGCTSFDKIQTDIYTAYPDIEKKLEVLNGKYKITAPDVIQIAVQDNPDLGTTSVIAPDGNVFIPLLGDVYVDGLTILQLREKMHKLLGRYLKDLPIESINVQVVGYNSKMVFVYTGYGATSISKVRFTGNLNVIDVLSQTGFLSTSNRKKITIIRPARDPAKKTQRLVVNLNDILKKGQEEDNIILKADDIIYIPPTILGRFTITVQKILSPVRPVAELGETYSDMKYDALGFDTQYDSGGTGGRSRR
jgi:polysaccharide export outer membrane protein